MSLKFTHNSFFLSITHAHARGAVLTIFLLFFTLQIGAQGFTSTSPYRAERKVITTQSAQVDEYQSYKSTIYQPFTNSTDGDSNPYEGDVDTGEWGDPTTANPGNTSGESPIGEPWIMLLFAAAAAVTVAWRKRKVT
jgi:hypothetical protein